jgi:hypothetical protein
MAIILTNCSITHTMQSLNCKHNQTRNTKYETTLANRSTFEEIEPLKLTILAQVTYKTIRYYPITTNAKINNWN